MSITSNDKKSSENKKINWQDYQKKCLFEIIVKSMSVSSLVEWSLAWQETCMNVVRLFVENILKLLVTRVTNDSVNVKSSDNFMDNFLNLITL